jgi:hypothetical protein
MRHVAFGLAALGVVAGGLLTVGYGLHGAPRLQAAESTAPEAQSPGDGAGGDVRVDAPGTAVNVDREHGKVSVTAPHTDVNVDTDRGRVKVRAPYVNLDISW